MSKRWVIGLVLVLGLVAFGAYRGAAGNAKVALELREDPQGARAAKTMLITFGERTLPVNYLRESGVVYMGIDGRWWREFADSPQPVELFIQGERYFGQARAKLDDPKFTEDIFSRLRPTVPEWLPDWLNGKLVIIELDPVSRGDAPRPDTSGPQAGSTPD